MSRRTRDVSPVASSYKALELRQAISRFLPHSGLGLVCGNGKLRWVPRMLVMGAILMTLDSADPITDRFHAAWLAVGAMWPTRRQPGVTYSGFMRALRRHSPRLLRVLVPTLREQVRSLSGSTPPMSMVGRHPGLFKNCPEWMSR